MVWLRRLALTNHTTPPWHTGKMSWNETFELPQLADCWRTIFWWAKYADLLQKTVNQRIRGNVSLIYKMCRYICNQWMEELTTWDLIVHVADLTFMLVLFPWFLITVPWRRLKTGVGFQTGLGNDCNFWSQSCVSLVIFFPLFYPHTFLYLEQGTRANILDNRLKTHLNNQCKDWEKPSQLQNVPFKCTTGFYTI